MGSKVRNDQNGLVRCRNSKFVEIQKIGKSSKQPTGLQHTLTLRGSRGSPGHAGVRKVEKCQRFCQNLSSFLKKSIFNQTVFDENPLEGSETLQQAKAMPDQSKFVYRSEIESGKPKLWIERCQKSSNFGVEFSEDFVEFSTGGFNQVGDIHSSQFRDGESEFEVGYGVSQIDSGTRNLDTRIFGAFH